MDARERLDVEDEDARQERLGQLLVKVDRAGEKTLGVPESSTVLSINRLAGGSEPAPVEPPTELLDRVRQFLPQLAESNASLSSRDQHELDIEKIKDGDSRYIEMNLGLGVFEYGKRRAHSDNGSSALSSSSCSSASGSDDEGNDSSCSDSSSSSEDGSQVAARPKKPLPRRAKQNITIPSGSGDPPHESSG